MADTYNRQRAMQDAQNPFLGRSPEELDQIISSLKSQIAQQQPQPNIAPAIGRGLGTAADLFLQMGGLKMPQQATRGGGLQEFMQKEMIKQAIKPKSPGELILEKVMQGEEVAGLPQGTTVSVGGLNIPVVPKKTAAQEKREVEQRKLSTELSGLLESFDRAIAEGRETVPFFGTRGIAGRLAGQYASLRGRAGVSPAIDVFNAQRKAFATTVAKAAGEVRPTDEDIRRFVETLPSPNRTDEENALIVADIQRKIQEGKIEELWSGGAIPTPQQTKKPQPPKVGGTFQGQKIINVERVE